MLRRPVADVASDRRLAIPWLGLLFIGAWLWTIWSCAEHWRGNPNYSYGWAVPLLALGFGLRRSWNFEGPDDWSAAKDLSVSVRWLIAGVCALLVFFLEFARQEIWHPQIVLLLICLLAVGASAFVFFISGGMALVRAQAFPVLFFFTAVPWPPRLEQPIRSTLMRWVATSTTEVLHWLGVEAQTSGGAIALRSGLVGITEACSGVRSLQAGIMFGLAIGEWFLLGPAKRILLLALAVALALVTNLGRTLALSLQAEWHGIPAVEQAHDLIGNITVTALIGGIWLIGKLLAPRSEDEPLISAHALKLRAAALWRGLFAPMRFGTAALVIAGLLGFIFARGAYAFIESRENAQKSAFFSARLDPSSGDRFVPLPREIWNELRPTSGEYLRRESAALPNGAADFYHFFWKPSPWNRFALVHRPDICMPGVGWAAAGGPDPVEVDFNGYRLRCYAFRFQRGAHHALQLWGVWRNGEPVPLDYEVAQIMGGAAASDVPALQGKRRSATEVIACTLVSDQVPPSLDTAVELVRSVFEYKVK